MRITVSKIIMRIGIEAAHIDEHQGRDQGLQEDTGTRLQSIHAWGHHLAQDATYMGNAPPSRLGWRNVPPGLPSIRDMVESGD
jgi:hypothetical protein